MEERTLDRAALGCVAALTLSGAWLRLAHLGALSLWSDDGFTWLAVRGILDHGIPLLPSGNVYWKNALFSYLTALPCLVLGVSEASLRLVNSLSGVAVVPVAYLAGRRAGGRLVGLALAALLTTSIWEVELSREARYYSCLQLIVLVTLALFHRAYLGEGSAPRPQLAWAAAVSMVAATLVQAQGATLWLLYPLLSAIRGPRRLLARDAWLPALVCGAALVGWTVFGAFFWKVGFVVRPGGGIGGGFAALFQGFTCAFFVWWWRLFPALTIACVASFLTVIALSAARRVPRSRWEPIALFAGYSVATLVVMGFGRVHREPRYIHFLYPVFLFVACAGSKIVCDAAMARFRGGSSRVQAESGALFAALLLAVSTGSNPLEALAVSSRGYLDAIPGHFSPSTVHRFHDDHQGPGLFVSARARPEDVIVAMHPIFARVYAGRCDGWLWSAPRGVWDAYHEENGRMVDNYLGTPLVRSVEGLMRLIEDTRSHGATLWLVTTASIEDRIHIQPRIARWLESQAGAVVAAGRDGISQVFAWRPAGAVERTE